MEEGSKKANLRSVLLAIVVLIGALAVALGFLYAVYKGAQAAPALFAAVITGTLTLAGLAWQRKLDQRREDKNRRIERLAIVYEDFLRRFHAGTQDGKLDEEDLQIFLSEFSRRLFLWGDPDVILKYQVWQRAVNEDQGAAFSQFMDFWLQAREDLGQSNKGLSRGDLIGLFLKAGEDLDELLPG